MSTRKRKKRRILNIGPEYHKPPKWAQSPCPRRLVSAIDTSRTNLIALCRTFSAKFDEEALEPSAELQELWARICTEFDDIFEVCSQAVDEMDAPLQINNGVTEECARQPAERSFVARLTRSHGLADNPPKG